LLRLAITKLRGVLKVRAAIGKARPDWTHDGGIARLRLTQALKKPGNRETMMTRTVTKLLGAAALAVTLAPSLSNAIELDPKVLVYQLPDQIKWAPVTPAGNQQAVLFGDPTKPGPYGVLNRWVAGNHFSKPHFHPNDRFITVISGTWWVGSGPNFDPANASVPMPAGSFVTHYGKQVHWDGAKDVDTVLLIVGEGPATATPFVAASQMAPNK